MSPKHQRQVRKTIFAFGEGETESIFLKHLRSFYSEGKAQIRVDYAAGKGVQYIVEKGIRIRSNNSFDYSFIMLDTTPAWTSSAKILASKNNFELIGSSPCIEALFLKILLPTQDFSKLSAQICKRRFSNERINGRRIMSDAECKKIFLRSRIDDARGRIPQLERVINILEGEYN